jgi:hypothetical protein
MSGYCPECGNTICMCKEIERAERPHAVTPANIAKAIDAGTPLPKREWVGLTDDELKEISNLWEIVYGGWVKKFYQDIEAKLKEKNT